MIVATDVDLAAMEQEIESGAPGFAVAARVALPHVAYRAEEIDSALEAAVANARALGIEDVIISNTLSGHDFLERTVHAFSALPIAIHLSAGGFVGRFQHARVVRFGRAAALSLTRLPLGPFEAATKRWFDIVDLGGRAYSPKPAFRNLALAHQMRQPRPGLLQATPSRLQHGGIPDLEVPHDDDAGRWRHGGPSDRRRHPHHRHR